MKWHNFDSEENPPPKDGRDFLVCTQEPWWGNTYHVVRYYPDGTLDSDVHISVEPKYWAKIKPPKG